MEKLIATNKKAYHDYFVEDTYEAGIVLVGCEVKSVRLGQINLRDSFVIIKNGEVFMLGTHISPYKMGSYYNVDPRRTRKLLLNRSEINKLRGKVEQKGYTLIPLKVYFKDALVKVEIGLCKGKELHDKRQAKRKQQKLAKSDERIQHSIKSKLDFCKKKARPRTCFFISFYCFISIIYIALYRLFVISNKVIEEAYATRDGVDIHVFVGSVHSAELFESERAWGTTDCVF